MPDHPTAPAALPNPLADGVPPGWVPHTRHSPLTRPWEPIYTQDPAADGAGAPGVALALRVAEPHCNSRGLAHGGLLSALADNAMGLSAVTARRAELAAAGPSGEAAPAGAVTVSLGLDFIDSARIGDWLSFHPQVLRHGRVLAFTECHVRAGDRLVARASATFRFV